MTPAAALPRCWRDQSAGPLNWLQRAWLHQPGALTVGLRRLGHVELIVRREAVAALNVPWAHEAMLAEGTRIWWREILMHIDGTPCVQACSFTPWRASQGAWQAIRGLGCRPLADILYGDPCISRSDFRFGRLRVGIRPPHTWVGARAGEIIEARHSVFWRRQQPLLVAEYFLPAFWALAMRPGATRPRGRFPLCEYARSVPRP